jgi:Tol biopolymer transport system component
MHRRVGFIAVLLTFAVPEASRAAVIELSGEPVVVGAGVVSSEFTEIRAASSPDGKVWLWGSTNRPDGPGGWNIWLARRTGDTWSAPEAVSFNSEANDFDPAFSPDGRWVYFFSNRPGGLGGDDIYRVAVTRDGFGSPEHLGPEVNSAGDEWAPGLSPDGTTLLFASNGRNGPGGKHDLFVSALEGGKWQTATPLPGAINTADEEFDATFLADGKSIVFARSPDLEKERITLNFSARASAGYERGTALSFSGPLHDGDALGPALDWHDRTVLLFSAAPPDKLADIYAIHYKVSQ